MKVKQKLYYVDISGKLYTYTVTNITDTHVEIAQEYAEKRRAKIKSNQMGE